MLALYGVNQAQVQRYLSSRSEKQAIMWVQVSVSVSVSCLSLCMCGRLRVRLGLFSGPLFSPGPAMWSSRANRWSCAWAV